MASRMACHITVLSYLGILQSYRSSMGIHWMKVTLIPAANTKYQISGKFFSTTIIVPNFKPNHRNPFEDQAHVVSFMDAWSPIQLQRSQYMTRYHQNSPNNGCKMTHPDLESWQMQSLNLFHVCNEQMLINYRWGLTLMWFKQHY